MYVAKEDFRSASAKWYSKAYPLTNAEIGDPDLDAAIAWACDEIIDLYCNDHFEPEPQTGTIVLDLDGRGSTILSIPKRIRSITLVEVRSAEGTLTTVAAGSYRVDKSLDAEGDKDIPGARDRITIIPEKTLPDGTGVWPRGPQTIRVTGSFSWAVTPGSIKKAVAMLVYDTVKPQRQDLEKARRYSTDDTLFELALTEPTGIPFVDRTIAKFKRPEIWLA